MKIKNSQLAINVDYFRTMPVAERRELIGILKHVVMETESPKRRVEWQLMAENLEAENRKLPSNDDA